MAEPYENETYMQDPRLLQSYYLTKNIFDLTLGTISILALLIGLSLFIFLRNMDSDRVRIHINLFISSLLVTIILCYEAIIMIVSADRDPRTELQCFLGQHFRDYAALSNTFWTTCEALHIAIVIYRVFNTQWSKWYKWCTLCFGWISPVIFISLFVLAESSSSENPIRYCGENIMASEEYLIMIEGPMILAYFVNISALIYVFNFVRIGTSQMDPSLIRGIRAVLILMPLLGLHHVLLDAPIPESKIKDILLSVITFSEGLVISILFCFTNLEVRREFGLAVRRGSTIIRNSTWVRSGLTSSISIASPGYGSRAH